MSAGLWAAAGLLSLAPLAAFAAVVLRSSYLRLQRWTLLALVLIPALLVAPATLLQRMLEHAAGIGAQMGAGDNAVLLLYALLVVAPVQMALVVIVVAPFWRRRRLQMRAGLSRRLEVREGVSYAVAAALGFGVTRDLAYLAAGEHDGWSLARIAVALPTFTLLCAGWGYVLGRNAQRGLRGRRFSSAWFTATVFHSASDYMIFRRGPTSLLPVLALLVCMLVGSWVLWRDQRGPSDASSVGRFSLFTSGPAPSLEAIRSAFQRHDRPLTLRWIAFGVLVTVGMITAGVGAAVYVGRVWELDFSAIDPGGGDATWPASVLAGGALAAFPGSGYLLARASRARSVLEPAISAALSIVVTMLFLGLLRPIIVVLVLLLTPLAFLLSCVGAWIGMGE